MLSDEERKAINDLNFIIVTDIYDNEVSIDKTKIINEYNKSVGIVLNLINKQSKEIEELSDKLTEKICKGVEEEILEEYRQTIISKDKEIEELKEDRKSYAEEYIHNNPWLYKQLNENYILRVESEQKERKAWIKGTNDADGLCNKKWEDKIKAKIEEYEKEKELYDKDEDREWGQYNNWDWIDSFINELQSLLEKE